MTGRPQTQRIGPLAGAGPPAPVSAPGPPPAPVSAPSLPPAPVAGLLRRAMMVPSTSVSSTASSASFAPNLLSGDNSPRGDGREGVEANAADNTILDAPPAESPRLDLRVRKRTLSRQESEPGLDQATNLGDRHVGTPPNPRARSVTGGSHDAEEQRAEEERLKRNREAWDSLQGQKIAMMWAAERDLRILTEEQQAKLDDLKRINEELRQSEGRRERMRLEEEKEERQAELERRVYNEHVQKLEEERREHARQWALKRRQAEQDHEMPPTSFQRVYAPSIAALNAALTMNHTPPPLAPQPPTVVPNLMLPDSASLNPSTSVGPQPPAVANPEVALPQTTMATEMVVNLGTTASHSRPIPTAVSSAPVYIPPARRPHVDPRPIHGTNPLNLNGNRSQSDGIH